MHPTVDPYSFGFLTTDLARLLKVEFDRRIAEAGIGLTAGEARALTHIARVGAARQAVIAEHMGVEAMTLSSYLDKLEQRGLVVRKPDTVDRRCKVIDLTEAAGDVLWTIHAIGTGVRNDAMKGIDPAGWAAMVDGLKQARFNLLQPKPAAAKMEVSAT